MTLKSGTVIRVKHNAKSLAVGQVLGDTFRAFAREEEKHLFRGGSETARDALKSGSGAWGLDLEVMETLARDHGVCYVEIPTPRGVYRTKMETLLGPKSFTREFGGHRPQVFLALEFWTRSTR
jgi:hypothetical protein